MAIQLVYLPTAAHIYLGWLPRTNEDAYTTIISQSRTGHLKDDSSPPKTFQFLTAANADLTVL